ncbi:MAG: DUF2752 domain-containing protein [Planctomycetes bacterium]|nr:DUF2752 domain-containing protein [Planctomycetota bacterium]
MNCTISIEPRSVDAPSTRNRLLSAAGLTAVVVTSYLYAPWSTTGPVLCPLRALTGVDCPGCGLTRSFCAMAHGHLAQAASFHWLGPLFFACAVAAIPLLLIEAGRKRRIEWFHRLLFSRRVAYAVAAVLVLHWAVDMVSDTRSGALLSSIKGSLLGQVIGWIA